MLFFDETATSQMTDRRRRSRSVPCLRTFGEQSDAKSLNLGKKMTVPRKFDGRCVLTVAELKKNERQYASNQSDSD